MPSRILIHHSVFHFRLTKRSMWSTRWRWRRRSRRLGRSWRGATARSGWCRERRRCEPCSTLPSCSWCGRPSRTTIEQWMQRTGSWRHEGPNRRWQLGQKIGPGIFVVICQDFSFFRRNCKPELKRELEAIIHFFLLQYIITSSISIGTFTKIQLLFNYDWMLFFDCAVHCLDFKRDLEFHF